MGIMDYLDEYKWLVIFIAFGVALGVIFDFLPKTIDILDLKENVKFIYAAVIALAAFCYFRYHYSVRTGAGRPAFQRTVPSRNLSNSEYLRHLQAQRAAGAYQRPPPAAPQPQAPPQQQPVSREVWDAFNKP